MQSVQGYSPLLLAGVFAAVKSFAGRTQRQSSSGSGWPGGREAQTVVWGLSQSRAFSPLLGNKKPQQAFGLARSFEVFRKLQTLALIVGGNTGAIELFGQFRHTLIDQAANHLTVFEHKGRLVAAHFQNPA